MNKSPTALCLAVLFGVVIGYFGGRWHLAHEISSAIESTVEELQDSFSSVFDFSSSDFQSSAPIPKQDKSEDELAKKEYIDSNVTLYEVDARYRNSRDDYVGIPGVTFKLRNDGERSLDMVEVTIYFKDETGRIIAEEDYVPVRANKPLRPGYIWQNGRGTFSSANPPEEWQDGSIAAAITDIEFTE